MILVGVGRLKTGATWTPLVLERSIAASYPWRSSATVTEPSASCPLVRSAESPEACSVRVSVARSGGPSSWASPRTVPTGAEPGGSVMARPYVPRGVTEGAAAYLSPAPDLEGLITQCDAHS